MKKYKVMERERDMDRALIACLCSFGALCVVLGFISIVQPFIFEHEWIDDTAFIVLLVWGTVVFYRKFTPTPEERKE